ncbi:pyridoxamine 5'-phosphate oxidase family protein [Amycolatopsis sp. DSM 110486]|uniref:pyridoxamine 5'-phosphate oxidase family protein n=1 Tax=Amycolatopsis sp. DSM 110486 TaxID=2865832 RepID=UPI001C697715|nr:pyridoxamine 5'-phosphate oxidase family protein [Amycolatopsis sp. DSM 110486]QYN18788.1 pyridoxamine 5'-phosphate oxidase family protein [Amycolatopsis sp. DSM 110486]
MATYHTGEIAVQDRAELSEQARFSLGGIGSAVPEVAAAFLTEQPAIFVGGQDAAGRVWASQLTGPPGFLQAPTPHVLTINALPEPGDPLTDILAAASGRPARLGMIALEPATRRRMRINGRAVAAGSGLRVDLDQVIANCPKYLQKRTYRFLDPDTDSMVLREVCESASLSPAQQQTVREADTFFIASTSDSGDADASHRGGNPGFVEVVSPRLLRWPDYVGNAMFLTLGNLLVHPAAGLLFPGWETGSALHLTGTARTVWDPAVASAIPGAQRVVEFAVESVREVLGSSPLRWSTPAYSRFNPPVR